ncbi:hypothetical protein QZH41_012815 [Actinostola sp. cb2023]|nr:hypothetical protein QZH41_012815 [Actinostola sp. cb2023]
MPALSPTMEEGTIVAWLKQEGEVINPGDALCEIETDKSTITMDTDEEGILAKILMPSGSTKVKVNELIALIVEEGQDYTKVDIPVVSDVFHSESEEANMSSESDTLVSLSPAVRFLIDTNSIDAKLIPATGRGGRILKGDILKYLSSSEVNTQPLAQSVVPIQQSVIPQAVSDEPSTIPPIPSSTTIQTGGYIDIPNTGMRSVIAKRLTESKTTIPHVYASTQCIMDNLQNLRQSLQERNIKVSLNDLIVKIAGVTLRQVPEMNAVWDGSAAKLVKEIDVAVAVATDGGLITPVVRDAANLHVTQISLVLKDLASRARSNKLQLHEFQGGSFTISNLGMFGITEFSAVINPPQASILAVGGTQLSLTADEVVHKVMTVTLSCDARMVDNELASRWLQTFKKYIENPTSIGL